MSLRLDFIICNTQTDKLFTEASVDAVKIPLLALLNNE